MTDTQEQPKPATVPTHSMRHYYKLGPDVRRKFTIRFKGEVVQGDVDLPAFEDELEWKEYGFKVLKRHFCPSIGRGNWRKSDFEDNAIVSWH